MQSITATEFKAKCLDILDHVPSEGLSITKRGKPVARLYPETKGISAFLGTWKGAEFKGDIYTTGEAWDAERGDWHAQP